MGGGESIGGSREPWVQILALSSWASSLISLSLSFLVCEMVMVGL